jgi:Ala-tRNA(Pro) deacylase
MNQKAFDIIYKKFESAGAKFTVLAHPPCRTSAESAETRAKAGFPEAVGAKALVIKMTFNDKRDEFNVLVMPGMLRLSSPKLKTLFPDMKKFRFATSEELFELCGVPSGAMPPFGSSVFPRLSRLFVDQSITRVGTVGFNAASLEKSIITKSADYLKVADYEAILNFVEEDQPAIAA